MTCVRMCLENEAPIRPASKQYVWNSQVEMRCVLCCVFFARAHCGGADDPEKGCLSTFPSDRRKEKKHDNFFCGNAKRIEKRNAGAPDGIEIRFFPSKERTANKNEVLGNAQEQRTRRCCCCSSLVLYWQSTGINAGGSNTIGLHFLLRSCAFFDN